MNDIRRMITLVEAAGLTDETPRTHNPDLDAAKRVIAAVKRFAAKKPITVGFRPNTRYLGGVVLTDLFATEPGNGVGTLVMDYLCRKADAASVVIYTDPKGPRSDAFYKKFGFVEDPSYQMSGHDLIRWPQAALREAADDLGFTIDAYHGTTGDFEAFAPQKGSHLGFHFGSTPTAANDRLNDGPSFGSGKAGSNDTVTAFYKDTDRERARTRINAEIAEVERKVNAIRRAASERVPPVDNAELLAALEANDETAIKRLLDASSPTPTPEEEAEIKRLYGEMRRLETELAVFFKYARPGEHVLPVKLKLENPVRMRDTNWGEPYRIRQDNPTLGLTGRTLGEIQAQLERRGYDGIVYRNEVEGIGEDSYIVFHPEQIRSRFARFDPARADSPNIMDSREHLRNLMAIVETATLAEAVDDHNLYHFTTEDRLVFILRQDKLGFPGWGDRVQVSLTRDTNHVYTDGTFGNTVMFVLDSGKLRQRYRLETTFGDINADPAEATPVNPELTVPIDDATVARLQKHGREAEERVHRAIEPLSRYLKEIVLNTALVEGEWWDQLEPIITGYAHQHGIPVSVAPFRYGSAWFRTRTPLG